MSVERPAKDSTDTLALGLVRGGVLFRQSDASSWWGWLAIRAVRESLGLFGIRVCHFA